MALSQRSNLAKVKSNAHQLEDIFRPLNSAEQKFAPKEIFAQGDLSLLSGGVRASLIGSRDASPEGLKRARKLASMLVERGIYIVSGLAQGVDTAAHKGAIEVGGRTIAVIGTPLSVFYPKENRALQEEIASKHLLLSQFAEGSKVNKGNFPTRNRLMALISDATVIVEAKDGSGTEHQGWEAIRLARPLWILQSSYDDDSLSWPKEFVKYGAQVLSEASTDQFFEMLPSRNYGLEYESVPF